MSDGHIRVSAPDALSAQAQLHYQMRDLCHQIVGDFDPKHETIASQMESGQAQKFRTWWETFRAHLLKLAQQHDEFGRHLEQAQAAYAVLEPHVATSFTRHTAS